MEKWKMDFLLKSTGSTSIFNSHHQKQRIGDKFNKQMETLSAIMDTTKLSLYKTEHFYKNLIGCLTKN